MNVEFFNIEDMIIDLKKLKIKQVRLQTFTRKKRIYFGSNGDDGVSFIVFEVIVTARNHDEIWSYTSNVGSVNENDDKRRLNTAKKNLSNVANVLCNIFDNNRIEVRSGVYK